MLSTNQKSSNVKDRISCMLMHALHTSHLLLMFTVLTLRPSLCQWATRSAPALLFPFLLDASIELCDRPDPQNRILHPLKVKKQDAGINETIFGAESTNLTDCGPLIWELTLTTFLNVCWRPRCWPSQHCGGKPWRCPSSPTQLENHQLQKKGVPENKLMIGAGNPGKLEKTKIFSLQRFSYLEQDGRNASFRIKFYLMQPPKSGIHFE